MAPNNNPRFQNVNLYFLGGNVRKDAPLVKSGERVWRIPEVGGYITIPLHYAQDIIEKWNSGTHMMWSLNRSDADRAKAGLQIKTTPVIDVNSLSTEDLQRILEERMSESETTDEEAPAPVRSKRKSKPKPEEVEAEAE